VKVLVADDHPLFRAGLCTLLGTDARIEAVGEVSTGSEAVAAPLDLRRRRDGSAHA
jgi:DNA-binding NarL/FixJ family response regulator